MGLRHTNSAMERALLGLPWRDLSPREAPGVVGVGIGTKVVGNRDTGKRCVKVYAAQKLDPGELEPGCRVPEEVGGAPTDVEDAGEVQALAFSERVRPIPGGSSIGHPDGGRVEYDAVASLAGFHPLHRKGVNNIDAALGRPRDPETFETVLRNLGPVRGTARPRVGMRVLKSGRTTEVTEGRIIDVDAAIRVVHGDGLLLPGDQIVIRGEGSSFSSFGDSGSLVVDSRNRAVGPLSGGSPFVTVANKILWVMRGMSIRFPRGVAA